MLPGVCCSWELAPACAEPPMLLLCRCVTSEHAYALLSCPRSGQFMNNDYVGEQKGRCGNFGYDKNEVRRARPTSDVFARVDSSCALLLAPDPI